MNTHEKTPEQEFAERLRGLAEEVGQSAGQESLRFHTNLHIELRGPDGELKDVRDLHNIVCTAGKNRLLLAAAGQLLSTFAYIAIGTGVTAAAITDTTLGAEVARSAVLTPTNPTSAIYQTTTTFAAGVGTGAITESGMLDAASVGNLFAHQVFAVINKGAGDTLAMTWQVS